MQQSQMALMLLGQFPNPQTGETVRDLDAARMFIDQLEMLEAKTKGNLSKDEEKLLGQSLMSLRLSFVEALEAPAAAKATPAPVQTAEGKPSVEPPPAPGEADDSKKKFSKKY